MLEIALLYFGFAVVGPLCFVLWTLIAGLFNRPAPKPRPWFVFDSSGQPPEWKPEILSAEEDAKMRRILGTADI